MPQAWAPRIDITGLLCLNARSIYKKVNAKPRPEGRIAPAVR